jgi:hypothetical protein
MWHRHVLHTQAATHSGLAIRTTTNPNIAIPLTGFMIWHHFTNDRSHSRLYFARSALNRHTRICPSQGAVDAAGPRFSGRRARRPAATEFESKTRSATADRR